MAAKIFTDVPKWKRIVAVTYVAAIAAVMIAAGDPGQIWWWAVAIPFLGWMAAPILVPLLHKPKMTANGCLIALVAGFSVYVYVRDMFGEGARSTSALIFIFLPLYQWIAAVIAILIGLVESYVRGQADDA